LRRITGIILLLLLASFALPAAAEPSTVAVRTGEHAGYSRVVFDWPAAVGVQVEDGEAGLLIVRFDRLAQFDLRKASTRHLTRVSAIEPVAGKPAVRILLRGAHRYQLATAGGKVVLDIVDGAAETPAAGRADVPQGDADAVQSLALAAVAFQRDEAPVSTAEADAAASPSAVTGAMAPGSAVIRAGEPIPDPLIDPAIWRGGGDFLAAEARLRRAVTLAMEDGPSLLALAQFDVAWRHADEALSVLDALAERDPRLAGRVDVMALRDAAALLAGRPAKVRGLFDQLQLRKRPEAHLWRGALAALTGRYGQALTEFEDGKEALSLYPPSFRSYLALQAMEAALDGDALASARFYQGIVADARPQADEAAMLDALTGVLLAKQQQLSQARVHLERAADSSTLRAQVIAKLTLIRLGIQGGQLAGAAAAEQLEQLYYAWEGDDLQIEVLDLLSSVLIGLGRYEKAFEVMALAQRQLPDDPRGAQLAQRARDLFRKLYADDSSALSPVATIALFHAHPELLPTGTEGIALTRALAKRLAAVDLVDEASQLLRETLPKASAEQQPEIGLELAELRLEAEDPAGAIAALDSSNIGEVHPDLQARRADAREAALVRAGRTVEALTAIGDATTPHDERARGDLYWGTGEWDLAAKAYLAAAVVQDGTAPSEQDGNLILRAGAALLLAGKADEMAALRARYTAPLASTSVAGAFDKITAPGAGVEVLAQPDIASAVVKAD
jgi:tetratricopeptide (TPR) repeat protein